MMTKEYLYDVQQGHDRNGWVYNARSSKRKESLWPRNIEPGLFT